MMKREIQNEIQEKLKEIEEKEQVAILYAVESGSRAWGIASPDSDYDVRFIYVRKPDEYLRLDPVKDVIEWQLDEVLDINGWDLKKALVQFQRGMPRCLSGQILRSYINPAQPGNVFMRQQNCIFQKRPPYITITVQRTRHFFRICRRKR